VGVFWKGIHLVSSKQSDRLSSFPLGIGRLEKAAKDGRNVQEGHLSNILGFESTELDQGGLRSVL